MAWFRTFLVVFLAMVTPLSLKAAPKPIDVSLISSVSAVGEKQVIILGLRFKMQEGWHTYWRSSGLTGYPMQFDWSGSKNLDLAKIYWPTPKYFKALGISAIGYKKNVILPIIVKLKEPGKPLDLSLKVNYLACSDQQCMPQKAMVGVKVPTGTAFNNFDTRRINKFIERVPELSSTGEIKIDPLFIRGEHETGEKLTFKATKSSPFNNPQAFLESPKLFYAEAPEIKLLNGGKEAQITFLAFKNDEKNEKPKQGFLTSDFVLTVADDGDVAVSKITPSLSIETIRTLIIVIVSAFLGGLILNFMPCVLPVISLKMFALLKTDKADLGQVRREFLLTLSGIIVSFWVLAAAVVFLKSIGIQVGWGMQFQKPIFLILIALILLLFTANLWGAFEVHMPRFLSRMTQKSVFTSGQAQHFFMGAFVTVLATPCTAPFLATAISFSLSRGAFEIFYIFTMMALGLGLPYIVLSLRPSIARHLPKPGHWMVTLKNILGGLVFLTLIWVLSILVEQLGVLDLFLFVLTGLLLALLLVLSKTSNVIIKRLTWVALVASIVVVDFLPKAPEAIQGQATKGVWLPFNEQAISTHVTAGKVVFIDVTADWCLTCKANEAAVLNTKEMQDYFKTKKVVLMKADWTLPRQEITDFLKKYNEYAIPFYIVYGPSIPYGMKLPQLLTKKIVKRSIEKAGM